MHWRRPLDLRRRPRAVLLSATGQSALGWLIIAAVGVGLILLANGNLP